MEKYRELRTQKEALQERHKVELLPVREAMDEIEIHLLRVMEDTGLSSLSSGDATAYKQTRRSARIADPHAFRAWVEAQNRPDFYENRVSKDVLDNWLEQGNDLPPGVEINSEVIVNIRKK
jgi:hypothetical protein